MRIVLVLTLQLFVVLVPTHALVVTRSTWERRTRLFITTSTRPQPTIARRSKTTLGATTKKSVFDQNDEIPRISKKRKSNNNLRSSHDHHYKYYLATCLPGLASVLCEEIKEILLTSSDTKNDLDDDDAMVTMEGTSAVRFRTASLRSVMSILYWSRTAHKILELLASTSSSTRTTTFHIDDDNDEEEEDRIQQVVIHDRNDLYQFVQENINVQELLWKGPLSSNQEYDINDNNSNNPWLTLSVQAILNNPRDIPSDICHSHYSALTIKNALCDMARGPIMSRSSSSSSSSSSSNNRDDDRQQRPNVNLIDPDVPLIAIFMGIRDFQYYNENDGDENDDAAAAHVSLYRQLHTNSLHKRGYRQDTMIHKAAMKESMAAGLLLHSRWHHHCTSTLSALEDGTMKSSDQNTSTTTSPNDPTIPQLVLCDPMAGSGTLVIEAALIAADMAPHYTRIQCGVVGSVDPPILRWNHYDDDTGQIIPSQNIIAIWDDIDAKAHSRAQHRLRQLRATTTVDTTNTTTTTTTRPILFFGNDRHPRAVELFYQGLCMVALEDIVQVNTGDCRDWEPMAISSSNNSNTKSIKGNYVMPWTVVTNPPWGVRLDGEDIQESWECLRDFVKQQCPPNSQLWTLCGNPIATRFLGLRKSHSFPLQTGEQDLRWIQYIIRKPDDNDDQDEQYHADYTMPPVSQQVQKKKNEMYRTSSLKGNRRLNQSPRASNNARTGSSSNKKNEWLI